MGKLLEKVMGMVEKKGNAMLEPRNDPDIVPEGLTEQRNIPYHNRSGKELLMDVYKPDVPAGTELPVIIVIHGGALVMGSKTTAKLFCEHLALRGYLVFALEYRLVPKVNICEQLDDVCAGMDCVGSELVKYDVDFTRIYLAAESAGAYLATYVAAMKYSEKLQEAIGYQPSRMRFKALGLISGMFYTAKKDVIGLFLSRMFYGKKYGDHDLMPYTNPEHPEIIRNLPPVYLITSDSDFLKKYTYWFEAALRRAGKECELLDYGKNRKLTHAFPVLSPKLPESIDAVEKMTAWFEQQAALHAASQPQDAE